MCTNTVEDLDPWLLTQGRTVDVELSFCTVDFCHSALVRAFSELTFPLHQSATR